MDILKPDKNKVHPLVYCVFRGSFECFEYLMKEKLEIKKGQKEEIDKEILLQLEQIGKL